jgi:ribonuclease-3
VLSLAMADLLLRRFPHEREGDLARRYSALVQAQTLAEIAQAIDLGHDMRLGDSEAQSGAVRPTILADGLEAVLARSSSMPASPRRRPASNACGASG